MVAEWCDAGSRAAGMGFISSVVVAAFVSGSAVTGYLTQLHPSAPSITAVSLYAVDAILVTLFLPPVRSSKAPRNAASPTEKGADAKADPKEATFRQSMHQAFANDVVGRFLCVKILYRLISGAAASMQVGTQGFDRSRSRSFCVSSSVPVVRCRSSPAP